MKTIGKILARIIMAAGFAASVLLSVPAGLLILLILFIRRLLKRLSNFVGKP